MNLTDNQLERIVKKANDKKLIKECEPQVCFPFQVEKWMVRRVIVAGERCNLIKTTK